MASGKVVSVIGPVVDVQFPPDALPEMMNAIEVKTGGANLIVEAAQMLGNDIVRCVAMDSTDGLQRGVEAEDTGGPITVPVGKETLGRVFNLLGDTIDKKGPVETEERWPIHRNPPSFEEQVPATEMFETGIKVLDLICPYAKGGKVGLFGGAGIGKTVLITELIRNVATFPPL